MKLYKLNIAPHYKGRNKNFYAYRGEILCYAYSGDPSPRTVWSMTEGRRRDVKAAGAAQLKLYQEAERLVRMGEEARKVAQLRREQNAGRARFLMSVQAAVSPLKHQHYGMLGRQHTEETKALIREKVAQRHREGAYAKSARGRPTKAESKRRAQERAKALGLSLQVYLEQLDAKRQATAQRKAAALAARSLTPAQARAAVVKKILK